MTLEQAIQILIQATENIQFQPTKEASIRQQTLMVINAIEVLKKELLEKQVPTLQEVK